MNNFKVALQSLFPLTFGPPVELAIAPAQSPESSFSREADPGRYCAANAPSAGGAQEVLQGAMAVFSWGRKSGGGGSRGGGADHSKGARKSTQDKHTKQRPGRTNTKQRGKDGWYQR